MADWRWIFAHGEDQMINFDQLTIVRRLGSGKSLLIWSDDTSLTVDKPTYEELQGELEKASQSSK